VSAIQLNLAHCGTLPIIINCNYFPRFVGTAVDGTILHLNLGDHLNLMVTENHDGQRFISHAWDKAHLIELADKDMKKDLVG
jgi:hypothetical protein